MRTTITIITPLMLLAVTACSKQPEERIANTEFSMQEERAADAMVRPLEASGEAPPPRISANVAPGVAFQYAYNFGLPAANISKVQEEHAALCERLGITHCRVTGMTYEKERDGTINAGMSFKLDPALAGSFGRDATDMVEKAEGTLSDSRVNGTDVGSQIVEGDKNTAQISAELAKIEAQLKIPNLSKDVRSRLVDQQGQLRARLRELSNDRDDNVESLATTPVAFSYSPNEAIFGFDKHSPIQKAFKASGESFTAMVSFVILAIGALAPWALLGGALFWLVRRLRPRKVDAAEQVQ